MQFAHDGRVLTFIPELGMIIPNMGTHSRADLTRSSVADALFSPVQQRVLGLLFGQPDRRFQSGELIRLARGGTGAVHRQLARLAGSGWLTVTRIGNQKHYQANRGSPAFAELHGLILKTVGLLEPIRDALARRSSDIHAAFIYGSVARGSTSAKSDVDLMVLSDHLTYPDVIDAMEPVESRLGWTINPTVMTRGEWHVQRSKPDSFVARIAKQPKLFVLGGDDDLA